MLIAHDAGLGAVDVSGWSLRAGGLSFPPEQVCAVSHAARLGSIEAARHFPTQLRRQRRRLQCEDANILRVGRGPAP